MTVPFFRLLTNMTGALAALAGVVVVMPVVTPSPAGAQEWSDWERPARVRPRPPGYFDEYNDYGYDDRRGAERRRAYRRYDRRFDRYREEGWFAPRPGRTARPQYEDENDFVDRDDTFDDRSPKKNPSLVSGGARPGIVPKAPPIVPFSATYKPGSIVIDTSARKLYFVRGRMSAFAYPIGVGKDGFSWTGHETVSRIADWPDWYPPADMRKRRPELPERMTGGINNPLGAKAIYLGNTLYRIHGTNDPKSIGRAESSGCFRMLNANVAHLATMVTVGADVTVVRSLGRGRVTADAADAVITPPRPRPAQRVQAQPRVQWSADPDPDSSNWDDNWR